MCLYKRQAAFMDDSNQLYCQDCSHRIPMPIRFVPACFSVNQRMEEDAEFTTLLVPSMPLSLFNTVSSEADHASHRLIWKCPGSRVLQLLPGRRISRSRAFQLLRIELPILGLYAGFEPHIKLLAVSKPAVRLWLSPVLIHALRGPVAALLSKRCVD